MSKRLKELTGLEERSMIDGNENVVRWFSVSEETAKAFLDVGWAGFAMADYLDEYPVLSVEAFEVDGYWAGWDYLHDEMLEVGLNPYDFKPFKNWG